MTASTPEQVRQITEQVLARPEFVQSASLMQIVTDRLFKWLGDLARWSGRNPHLARLLIIGLSVILLGLIAHIVYTAVREFLSLRKREGVERRLQPLRALEGVAENWRDAFKLARAALDAGDIYRALWITHRVLLSVLDRTGQIKFVRWKTNNDYLRECGDSGDGAATLLELSSAYESVIYAHDDFESVYAAELLAKVETLAGKANA
jgi:hypothetical protein